MYSYAHSHKVNLIVNFVDNTGNNFQLFTLWECVRGFHWDFPLGNPPGNHHLAQVQIPGTLLPTLAYNQQRTAILVMILVCLYVDEETLPWIKDYEL